jgi:opacity protein-like surface antigen
MGTVTSQPSDLRILQPQTNTDATLHGVRWRSEATQPTYYYGFRYGGYFQRYRHWGLELNYQHSKAVLMTDGVASISGVWNGQAVSGIVNVSDYVQRLRVTNGINMIGLYLLYRTLDRGTPAFPQGRWQLYTGIGPSFNIAYNSNEANGVDFHSTTQLGGVGFGVMLGVRYGLARKWSLFVEGKYTYVPLDLSTSEVGRLMTTLNQWHLNAGLLYAF